MTTDSFASWPPRLLRAAGLVLLGGAVLVWLTPLSVGGKNLQPFGCGSPAAPMQGQLATMMCGDDITGARHVVLALIVAVALLLVVSQLLAPRFVNAPAFRGLAVVLPLALPIAALSAVALFSPVGTEGSDGSLIRCGTALDPVTDPFARGTCGHLPERQKALSFGGIALSALLIGGGAYVTSGKTGRPDDDDLTPVPGDVPRTHGPAPEAEVRESRRNRQ